MKTIATAIAAIALVMGVAPKAEAREYCGDRYQTSVYISGRASCGTPIYTQRYVVRVDRYGHVVWGTRTLPVSYHGSRGYGGGYSRSYQSRGRDHCEPSRDRDYDRRRSSGYDSDRAHREFIRGIYR